MKILIVGGVAGGATAAARARRISETADITIVERGPYVSYANCGLPYYISRDIQKRSKLLLQTPEGFDSRYGVKVLVDTEAIEIDRAAKRVRVRGPEGESWLEYDSLILAQGGNPVMPALPGLDAANVFRLWTVPDMDAIHEFVETRKPATAVIAGGGIHRPRDGGGFCETGDRDDRGGAAAPPHVRHGSRVRRHDRCKPRIQRGARADGCRARGCACRGRGGALGWLPASGRAGSGLRGGKAGARSCPKSGSGDWRDGRSPRG